MEDVCNLCNVIEIFCPKKVTKPKKEGGLLVLSNSKWHWHNYVKTYPPSYLNIQIPPLLKGGIDRRGVAYNSSIL
jgi:hypothetical protein